MKGVKKMLKDVIQYYYYISIIVAGVFALIIFERSKNGGI